MSEHSDPGALTELGGQLSALEFPHQLSLVLLAHVLGREKTWVLAHPEAHLTPAQKAKLDELTERLLAGEPLPYILGQQEFMGLMFKVSPAVLIPRPETELLVEQADAWLSAHPLARRAADVGTGSGCIAISLAARHRRLGLVASDISTEALELASENARRHSVENQIEFIAVNMLPEQPSPLDLICANLPYIPSARVRQVNSLPYEPRLALDGGADGLQLISRLLATAPQWLKNPGLLLLETEAALGAETVRRAQRAFPEAEVSLLSDLAGRDRLVRVERMGQ